MEIFRSLLYVPADKPRMIEKARQLKCDAVIFDLEDAVGLPQKAEAREQLRRALTDNPFPIPYVVRVNAVYTPFFYDDIQALSTLEPIGIILPKADEQAVIKATAALENLEKEHKRPAGSLKMIPLIESAKAVETMAAIVGVSPRIIGAQLGAEDLTVDLGIQRTLRGDEIAYARNRIVYGCRAVGLPAYDTPFLHYKNPEALTEDCRVAKAMGFAGKTCIHPSQIDIVQRIFSPSEQEIREAKHIVAAAKQEDGGAFSLDGRMIDGPVIERAKRILQMVST